MKGGYTKSAFKFRGLHGTRHENRVSCRATKFRVSCVFVCWGQTRKNTGHETRKNTRHKTRQKTWQTHFTHVFNITHMTEMFVLEFLKHQSNIYPTVSKVALVLLSVTSSSFSGERNFSYAGFTWTDRTTSLDADKANETLFIRFNYDVLWFVFTSYFLYSTPFRNRSL